MTAQLLSPEAFHKMVKEMIQEAIKEEMLKEFKTLEEATAGTISSSPSISTVSTSSSTGTTGTKPSVGSKPGNDDPANNVMIPGTNMNINQALQAAAKEPNFKKKADLTTKITNQIAGMKGVVMKEGAQDGTSVLQRVIEMEKEVEAVKQGVSALAEAIPKTAVFKGFILRRIIEDMRVQINKGEWEGAAKWASALLKDPSVKLEGIDEPDMPMIGGKKANTREPMFPDLINRITNMVYYGDKPDEEILADLGPEVSENPKMVRWAKFIADMVRKGKDVMAESRKNK
jgi:hypothetical protein